MSKDLHKNIFSTPQGNPPDPDKLEAYFKGTLSEKEAYEVEKYLLEDELTAEALEGLGEEINSESTQSAVADITGRAWKRVAQEQKKRRRSAVTWTSIAASVILLIVAGWFFIDRSESQKMDKIFAENFETFPGEEQNAAGSPLDDRSGTKTGEDLADLDSGVEDLKQGTLEDQIGGALDSDNFRAEGKKEEKLLAMKKEEAPSKGAPMKDQNRYLEAPKMAREENNRQENEKSQAEDFGDFADEPVEADDFNLYAESADPVPMMEEEVVEEIVEAEESPVVYEPTMTSRDKGTANSRTLGEVQELSNEREDDAEEDGFYGNDELAVVAGNNRSMVLDDVEVSTASKNKDNKADRRSKAKMETAARTQMSAPVQAPSQESKEAYDEGMVSYKRKDYRQATYQFETAGKMQPDNQNAWFYAGVSHLSLDEPEKALENLEKVQSGHKNYEDALWYRALAHIKLKEKRKAKKLLQDLLSSDKYKDKATKTLEEL